MYTKVCVYAFKSVLLLNLILSCKSGIIIMMWKRLYKSYISFTDAILVAQRATEACKLLQRKDEEALKALIPKIEKSFLGSIVRQMVLLMTYLCPSLSSSSRVSLLQNLQPFCQELMKLASVIPDVFPTVSESHFHTCCIPCSEWLTIIPDVFPTVSESHYWTR